MPALMDVGIHTIINGPITYTIDGAPLVGPVPGKRNAYCIIGLRAGLGEGGGHGWLLAQQIVQGEACFDTWCLDPRRFSGHANVELTAVKAIEDYQNEFRFHFPHEHRPAGRPIKTTPLTPILAAQGAEFAVVNGWERMDYVKPTPDFHPSLTFRFDETFDIVGGEVANVHDNVGLTEISGFNRFELTGSNVHDFLDRMMCGQVTRKVGKVGLGYLLNHHGMLKSEATIANLADDQVWYGSAAASEYHDMDWLRAHIEPQEDVTIRSLTNDYTILVLAGPRSREVMRAVSRDDWSKDAFAWLSVRRCYVGIAPAVVMAVSFSGELAYEIHVPNNQLYAAYLALTKAGEAHNMRLFGARAIESMRLEKGYLHWKADILTEFDPFETGLERFVEMEKGEFIGKTALAERMKKGPAKKLVTLEVVCKHAPAHGGASVIKDGTVVGTVTSGEWGHRLNKNICLAFINPDIAAPGNKMTIDVLGEPVAAHVIDSCPYDRPHQRVRS